LLAVVEIISREFQAGDLGPSTIVGSASFNLLFIIAICVVSLDPVVDEETGKVSETHYDIRKIEEFGVFGITAVFSLWAYFWLVVSLDMVSSDYVDLWEAILTLLMFPILVFVSWAQDKNWFMEGATVAPEQKVRRVTVNGGDVPTDMAADAINAVGREIAASDPQAAGKLAAQEAMRNKKKSRLEYRIQATRQMTGGKSIMPGQKKKKATGAEATEGNLDEKLTQDNEAPVAKSSKIQIGFEESSMKVMEDCGIAQVKVNRVGFLDKEAMVTYSTSDGTAKAQNEQNLAGRYVPVAQQVLKFAAGEESKVIQIHIIDDNEWQPDEHFFVSLTAGDDVELMCSVHSVIILNDDDPGKFAFSSASLPVMEADTQCTLTIDRVDGVSGQALCYVRLVALDSLSEQPKLFGENVILGEGAQVGTHYKQLSSGCAGPESLWNEEDGELEVVFQHEQDSQEVVVELVPGKLVGNVTFVAEITHIEPAGAKVGQHKTCAIIKSNDKNYQKLMEDIQEIMEKELAKYSIETETWGEQFIAAMSIEADDDDDGEGEGPDTGTYVLHFLSFYWKVIHAFVPPTSYGGGWWTFAVSLAFIGAITCCIGDVAKMFGCILGLQDSVTAITFVALGTSLPDTFASKEATIGDDTADAAITNVTGSNSVNVFLGLGIPWTLACLYHSDNKLAYPAGDLVFSVLIFFAAAVYCLGLLVYRRSEWIGGELGGPIKFAWFTSFSLVVAWTMYIVMSSLKAEGKL
jgi:solute carrier family 8 (sodium/calcium exchanger)